MESAELVFKMFVLFAVIIGIPFLFSEIILRLIKKYQLHWGWKILTIIPFLIIAIVMLAMANIY